MLFGSADKPGTVMIVGASRGLGLAMASEFLERKWTVLATEREASPELHELATACEGKLEIETVDITRPDQIAALRERLSGRSFDIVFSNAGTANRNQDQTIAEVSTDEFVHVMVTNALGPMRVVEALQDLVPADGLIGVMSSGQGSVGDDTKGGHEVYRGSKSALNQYMRSYAARHAGDKRALLLVAPGWVRTELGGPNAPLSIEDSIPNVVDVLIANRGKTGLRYLDRNGKTVPW